MNGNYNYDLPLIILAFAAAVVAAVAAIGWLIMLAEPRNR